MGLFLFLLVLCASVQLAQSNKDQSTASENVSPDLFNSVLAPYFPLPDEITELREPVEKVASRVSWTANIVGKVLGIWTGRNITRAQARSSGTGPIRRRLSLQPFLPSKEPLVNVNIPSNPAYNYIARRRGRRSNAQVEQGRRAQSNVEREAQRNWPTWVGENYHQQQGPHHETRHPFSTDIKSFVNREFEYEVEELEETIPFNRTENGELITQDVPMFERRSIPQFGNMVTLYTRTNPLRFLFYGNWCGSGGGGPVLDATDLCCKQHDYCYSQVQKSACPFLWQRPYTAHYSWRWDEHHQEAYCLRTKDRCLDHTCECDRVAAECFGNYMLQAKLQGNRLRKGSKRRPFRG